MPHFLDVDYVAKAGYVVATWLVDNRFRFDKPIWLAVYDPLTDEIRFTYTWGKPKDSDRELEIARSKAWLAWRLGMPTSTMELGAMSGNKWHRYASPMIELLFRTPDNLPGGLPLLTGESRLSCGIGLSKCSRPIEDQVIDALRMEGLRVALGWKLFEILPADST